MATSWSARLTVRLALPPAPRAVDPGQVSGLTIAAGSVTAQVHGARHEPYDVWIDLPVFTPAEWDRAERALAADADCHDAILDGEPPPELEALFARCDLSLLPALRDLVMDCSCPDWVVPCEHVTAVLRALADAFDADPFDVLTWRGRTRERLLRHLHALRRNPPPVPGSPPAASSPPGATGGTERPLGECLDDFWREGPVDPDGPADHGTGAGLPGSSGPRADDGPPGLPDLTIRGHHLAALLRPAYRAFRTR